MFFRWKKGRQNSGYEKMLLAQSQWPIPFDLYLLRYKKGSFIDWHKDPVKDYKHYRANLFLKNSSNGGFFEMRDGEAIISTKRLQIFRPDLYEHRVTKVEGSTRYVLSFGWAIKN